MIVVHELDRLRAEVRLDFLGDRDGSGSTIDSRVFDSHSQTRNADEP